MDMTCKSSGNREHLRVLLLYAPKNVTGKWCSLAALLHSQLAEGHGASPSQ